MSVAVGGCARTPPRRATGREPHASAAARTRLSTAAAEDESRTGSARAGATGNDNVHGCSAAAPAFPLPGLPLPPPLPPLASPGRSFRTRSTCPSAQSQATAKTTCRPPSLKYETPPLASDVSSQLSITRAE